MPQPDTVRSDLPPRESATSSKTPELNPNTADRAQRGLVAKALAELAHERLLSPTAVDGSDSLWEVRTPVGVTYRFAAQRYSMEHWVIDPDSLGRHTSEGEPLPLDSQALILELRDNLAIPEALLPIYLEEIAATLAGAMWKLHHHQLTVADLIDADHQVIEAAMTQGHPSFIANNGRIGFSREDHAAYAPETGSPVHLVWVAVTRRHGRLSLGSGLDEAHLLEQCLQPVVRQRFSEQIRSLSREPADFFLLPLHPWQWRHKIAITFAPEIARGDIIFLGEGPDPYQAQQSIRTFANTQRPESPFIKTALSIQNMGFLRGLSPRYMAATPAINDWVADLVAGDDELQSCGFTVLREMAAIGWTGDPYHAISGSNAHQKMLAALWRESPSPHLGEGERLMTMAGLLHRDHHGQALVTELVQASGLQPEDWLQRYLRAYLRPLVHCLLAYDLAFMPHGENVILVMRDHVPVRAIMKDLGEEIAVMGDIALPAEVERVRARVVQSERALTIFTDVFDGFLRHLCGILAGDGLLTDEQFWGVVAEVIKAHAADNPQLREAADRHNLHRQSFDHSCLNRLQLRNTLNMVDLSDQAQSLIFAGQLTNPVATARP